MNKNLRIILDRHQSSERSSVNRRKVEKKQKKNYGRTTLMMFAVEVGSRERVTRDVVYLQKHTPVQQAQHKDHTQSPAPVSQGHTHVSHTYKHIKIIMTTMSTI